MNPTESHPVPSLNLDSTAKTLRPVDAEGDDYFGLSIGTNGTAAVARRAIAEIAACGVSRADRQFVFVWVRSNGRPATGMTLVPNAHSDLSYVSPWGA